jgi:hemolysin activation/secretion protein
MAHALPPISAPAPSRVAPESLVPLKPSADGTITLPEHVTAQAPLGADQLSVTIAAVNVEGGSPAFAGVIQSATAGLPNHPIKVSDLYDAAARIEAAYARAGYVLTRVTLPPQRIVDGGTVRVLIVAGFIESVDVSHLPRQVRAAVRRRAAALIGQPGLTMAQIERRVLLAGDVPGVQLRSTLLRGQAVGATQLVLEADYHPLSGSLSAENDLGSAYQYEAFSVQLALNSVLGFGEQLYLQASSGPDFTHLFSADTRRRVLGGGAIVPLGANGLTVNPEFTRVDTNPRSGPGTAQATGDYERFALRASYPLIRSRQQSLTLTGGLELITENQVAQAIGPLSRDRLRVIDLGATYNRALSSRLSLVTDGQLAMGLAGLGARNQADADATGIPLSRQGSRPDYRKINARAQLDELLGGGFNLTSITRGQASFTGAMPSSAQFSLDGTDGLSSFSQGTINVDSGLTERLELAYARSVGSHGQMLLTPYVFGAAGYGHLADPTTGAEAANLRSWSAGGGLRLLLSPQRSALSSFITAEVSHGHVNTLTSDIDPTRVSATLSLRF